MGTEGEALIGGEGGFSRGEGEIRQSGGNRSARIRKEGERTGVTDRGEVDPKPAG